MGVISLSLYAVWASAYLLTAVLAGDIILYPRTSCDKKSQIFTVLSASESSSCTKLVVYDNAPYYYGVSTSRNIGPSCTFSLYTDANCKKLAQKLISSGPYKACAAIKPGARSYKVICGKPRGGALSRPKNVPGFESEAFGDYLQPKVTYRGKPSGGIDVSTFLIVNVDQKSSKPTGSAETTAVDLASAYFNTVPSKGYDYTVSTKSDATRYTLQVAADKNAKYTAEKLGAALGEATFASILADSIIALMQSREVYIYYSVSGPYGEIGTFNVTQDQAS